MLPIPSEPPLDCVDCVVDCHDKDCQLVQAPAEDLCTDQCVVVACSDQDSCSDKSCSEVCLKDACRVEHCDGGANCTGDYDEFIQCCTDLHACLNSSPSDMMSSQINWGSSIDDILSLSGVSHDFSAASQLSEFAVQMQNLPSNSMFSEVQHGHTDFGLMSQGIDGSEGNQRHVSPSLSQTPSQGPSVSRSPLEFACRWSNCNASFFSLNELVGHVNLMHLRPPASPPRPTKRLCMDNINGIVDLMPLSCHWDDCQIYPNSSAFPGPSCGLQPEAALGMLSSHLLHDHLGLSVPPTPPSFDLDSNEEGAHQHQKDHDNSISECVITQFQSLQPQPYMSIPTSTSGSDVQSEPTPVPSYMTPESSPPCLPAANEPVHDCATATHICRWEGCGASFDTCASLTEHLTSAHVGGGKSRYDCHWADCSRFGTQGFTSKQKILRHLQAHTGHRPFACTVCGQHFSEAATLQQHMRRHTQEKPFICDFPSCGKAFAITGALTIHKRTHNGERPFKCPHCNRAFAESSNLSKHLRTHTGDRPYRCAEPGCGKAFARPDQLQRHGNVHTKRKAQVLAFGLVKGQS
ncbi:hypothetical protein DFH11DRAFT_1199730 [Phellopilus nigrolimitatus]|nr:hypothetical protein DFH11DRAFT_1199730 [Phellopilus nigrolimitatus]